MAKCPQCEEGLLAGSGCQRCGYLIGSLTTQEATEATIAANLEAQVTKHSSLLSTHANVFLSIATQIQSLSDELSAIRDRVALLESMVQGMLTAQDPPPAPPPNQPLPTPPSSPVLCGKCGKDMDVGTICSQCGWRLPPPQV